MGSESFQEKVERFVQRPELQKVFDEAKRLAKDPAAKERIEQARSICDRPGRPAKH